MPMAGMTKKAPVRWPAKVPYISVQQPTWATKDTAKLNEKTVWVAFARPAWVSTAPGNFRPPLDNPFIVNERGP